MQIICFSSLSSSSSFFKQLPSFFCKLFGNNYKWAALIYCNTFVFVSENIANKSMISINISIFLFLFASFRFLLFATFLHAFYLLLYACYPPHTSYCLLSLVFFCNLFHSLIGKGEETAAVEEKTMTKHLGLRTQSHIHTHTHTSKHLLI